MRKKVEVVNYPDGRFAVQCNGTSLAFRVFDKIRTVQPGDIVDSKRLSTVLAVVKARQADYGPNRQRGHVARQRPPNNLEAPGATVEGASLRHDPGHGGALTALRLVARRFHCAGQERRPQGLRCAPRQAGFGP